MYPIPPFEKLVETKICRHCLVVFPITDKDREFYEKISPTFSEKKYSIPTPTLCPDCRQQRRLSFRNERKLYKRKCDAIHKDIISIYSPDKPFKVYHQDYWWSDKWDPMDYRREFDFERWFFEQFGELVKDIPHPHSDNTMSENSEYGNFIGYMKSCYLVSASWECENVLYSSKTRKSGNCVDILSATRCEECYECIDCESCWKCTYCLSSFECANSTLLFDCIGCEHCYRCSNLVNKKYCIDNVQYSHEEYDKKITNMKWASWEKLRQIRSNTIQKYSVQNRCTNCSGDQLSDSENLFQVFDFTRSKDCKYMELWGEDCFDSYDAFWVWWNATRTYEVVNTGENVDMAISTIATLNDSNNVFYSWYIRGSSHLFWCIGLRNKSYCILNKQYTREEYEALVPLIIEHMMKTGEWWEFFPSTLSPFGYNETVAMEYYPIAKERATQNGIFNWSDYEAPFPKVEKIIPASKLPDDITKIPDDILNWAIECEVTKKPFRIIQQELEFYRKHHLPIPRRHPDQRHLDRMALRNPRKLFERKCDKCGVEMITTYSPERPEIVYCEKCYNKEVIW